MEPFIHPTINERRRFVQQKLNASSLPANQLLYIGDDVVFKTLEAAEAYILKTCGVRVTSLQGEHPKDSKWRCAGYFVGEFVKSDKPISVVVSECPVPITRGSDHCLDF